MRFSLTFRNIGKAKERFQYLLNDARIQFSAEHLPDYAEDFSFLSDEGTSSSALKRLLLWHIELADGSCSNLADVHFFYESNASELEFVRQFAECVPDWERV